MMRSLVLDGNSLDVIEAGRFLFVPNNHSFAKNTIWFYWGQGKQNAPEVVQLAYRTWCELNPEFVVTFLDDKKVTSILGSSIHHIIEFSTVSLGHAGKSDLLRLYLLYHFGGIWVDATTFCLKPLRYWLKISSEFPFQHFSQPMTCKDRRLVSWFLAAEPKSPFIKEWLQESICYLFKKRYTKLNIGAVGEDVISDSNVGRNITGYKFLRECEKYNKTPYFWLFYLFNEVAHKKEFQQLIEKNESLPQRYVQPGGNFSDFSSAYISKQTYRDDFDSYTERVEFVEKLLDLQGNIGMNAQDTLMKERVLLCTGFHRSATSATANYLHDAGLNMGLNLMGGSISNVKGHFEDLDAVALHDEQLALSGTNWQFHQEVDLTPQPEFLNEYISKRSNVSQHWGVKDPRACLFLKEWQQSLGDAGCFLFVARHWSSCIESLLHRHSRDLAYSLPVVNRDDSADAQFWVQPELAAEMWLSYNQNIVAFAKDNPSTTIIATQRALFEDAPIVKKLNSKFGFALDENIESPFEASLFRDKANERIFSQISHSLQARLNRVWDELIELATFTSTDETPHIVKEEMDERELQKLQTLIASNRPRVPQQTPIHSDWVKECLRCEDPNNVIAFLDATTLTNVENVSNSDWLPVLSKRFSLHGQVLISIAKLLMRTNDYLLAVQYFGTAISLGAYFPFVDMLIAQCHQKLGQTQQAEFFYNKAIKANPNNPHFYIYYAQLLAEVGRDVEADKQFQVGFEKGKHLPISVSLYGQFLDKQGRTQDAITLVSAFLVATPNPQIELLLSQLLMKRESSEGKRQYLSIVNNKIKGQDKYAWLARTCYSFSSSAAERDFILRCLAHWQKLDAN